MPTLDELREAAGQGRLILTTVNASNLPTMVKRPMVDPLADASAWADRNPEAYQQMILWAQMDMATEGSRPSTKLYIEILRRPHFAHMLGLQVNSSPGPVKIPNALSSGLARLIMRDYPDIVFPTAEAKADRWRSER